MPEPKTIHHWISKGYQFVSLGNCDACGLPVEIWTKTNQLIPLNPETLETHNSGCSKAKEFRMEQRMKAGVI